MTEHVWAFPLYRYKSDTELTDRSERSPKQDFSSTSSFSLPFLPPRTGNCSNYWQDRMQNKILFYEVDCQKNLQLNFKKKENTCASVVLYTEWMCDCHVLLKVSNTAIAEVSWSVPFIYIVIEFKQIKCPHLFVSYPDISFSALVESWLNCHVYFVFSVKSWMGNNTTDSFLP